MGKQRERERQLCRIIDRQIQEMNEALQADLKEEQQIDRKLSDVRFRDDVVSHIGELIRLRKLGERFKDEENLSITYEVRVQISAESMRTVARIRDKAYE